MSAPQGAARPNPVTPPAGDQRCVKRVKTFWPTQILVEASERRAHVLDISVAGLRLDTAADLAPGADLHLRLRDLDLAATVVWRRSSRLGVRFSTALESDQLATLLGSPDAK